MTKRTLSSHRNLSASSAWAWAVLVNQGDKTGEGDEEDKNLPPARRQRLCWIGQWNYTWERMIRLEERCASSTSREGVVDEPSANRRTSL